MAVQQRKVSKCKVRSRKAANRYKGVRPGDCPVCGAAKMPHRVCRQCGHYNGRQVLSVTAE
jgi:large subunit ribosomal protein L32